MFNIRTCQEELAFRWQDVHTKPEDGSAWRALGACLFEARSYERAILAFTQATRLNTSDGYSWLGLARAQSEYGLSKDALDSFTRATLLLPRSPSARLGAAVALPRIISSWNEIRECRRRMSTALNQIINDGPLTDDDWQGERKTNNFYSVYHNLNDRHLQSLLARAHLAACPKLAWTAPHCYPENPFHYNRRIRLGIASAFLCHHTIGKLNLGTIQELNKDQFEVFVLRSQPSNDSIADAVDDVAADSIVLSHNLVEAREAVARLKLDVLHYPEIGMSSFFYLLAFARLAPIQTVSWGHPNTTGIPSLDYFISSTCLEPHDAQLHYTEQLVRLDGPPTCYRRPAPPPNGLSRAHFGLPESAHIYACPHTLFRFHPDFDDVIRSLIQRDPAGYVIFIDDTRRPLWGKLLRRRLSSVLSHQMDRILFLPSMEHKEFLNLLRLADCILDPNTFGGGNTTYESFAVGTPVVTWKNAPFLRGRITSGLYSCMGISHMVAQSSREYVEIAAVLANDGQKRREASQLIGERSALIFNNTRMVRNLETFWREARAATRSPSFLRP
jgi:protein O-GlcNAc transferase